MKRLMLFGASFAAFAVVAAEYTWVDGSVNWDDPKSYRDSSGNAPASLPGGEDSVKIVSAAVEVAASDSAAWNQLNSIGYLTLSSATLTLNCDTDKELAGQERECVRREEGQRHIDALSERQGSF